MNKTIEKLLNGAEVEWKTLGEVAVKISSGGTPKTDVEDYYNGNIPWLRTQEVGNGDIWDTGVKITELGLKSSSAKIIPENCVIVAMYGATVGKVGINKIPLSTNQACANIQLNKEIVHYRYVYHFLLSQYEYIKSLGAGSQTNINIQIVKNLKLPIPPLSVQQEIVRILDAMTALTAELTTELTLRQKQYQYYRNKLLNFDDRLVGAIEWKVLGEVAEYSKIKIKAQNVDETNYIGVDNLLPNRAGKALSNYVPKEGNLIGYSENDILIGNIRPYLKKIWFSNQSGGTNGDVLAIHITNDKINAKYLFQILSDDKFFEYNMKHAKGAKMPRGNKQAILEYKIPIPSLEEQNRIVQILDKFDRLTNSISEGLPHEIVLRQKQYEYYREQLLDFK
ncbi:restriction endonuclease subunit S [Pasteurellaceae bacterium LIM206]|nr:restriction endonuclease subunit S [Pasteurellaceae bacterium LIM206]